MTRDDTLATNVALVCIGVILGLLIGVAVHARMTVRGAVENGEGWMHARGVHPSHVSCSPDDVDGDDAVLCAFFVPGGERAGLVTETVQIFECDVAPGGSCREPWE